MCTESTWGAPDTQQGLLFPWVAGPPTPLDTYQAPPELCAGRAGWTQTGLAAAETQPAPGSGAAGRREGARATWGGRMGLDLLKTGEEASRAAGPVGAQEWEQERTRCGWGRGTAWPDGDRECLPPAGCAERS